jgi:hypothetical protein
MATGEATLVDYWKEKMLDGNFEQAWQFSDKVLNERKDIPCWHLPRHEQYIWNGTPLQGKIVLVRCYHGLGDTILFIRYAPLIKMIAQRVIVWAQESLLPLLKTVQGIDELLPLHDGEPGVEYDVDLEVMELPYIFRTTLDTIPRHVPYIHMNPIGLPEDRQFKVGLTWQVSNWEHERSIPFIHLLPLFDINGISIYVLQENAPGAGWLKGFGIYPGPMDLVQFAQWVKAMDLVITVDSLPAHMAGAQNVPVWTILRKNCDWRWMRNRSDSPWYPSMKLFRQKQEGDWDSVLDDVAKELSKSISKR